MLSTPTTTCANHRKKERVASCGLCGSALCIDCVVHTAVGVKCRKCTGGAAATSPTATAKARAARHSADGQGARKQKKWALPMAVAGAALLVAFAAILFTRGGGSSKTDPTAAAAGPGASADDHMHDGGAAGTDATASGSFVDKKADFTGGGNVHIGASLSVPNSLGSKSAPGVLIIPGGGAQDRNGGIEFNTNLPDPLYQDLAEAFAQAGMVSLRYDKRGTGQSQLGVGLAATWDGMVEDAAAGLKFLRERRETQGQPITVVGYDQAGFIAMKLAQTEPSVKGVVLISVPGRPIGEVIASDFLRGVPDPVKAQQVSDAMKAAVAQVVSTGTIPRLDSLPEDLRTIFNSDPNYLKGLFSFDPVAEAGKVKVPTLVVRGGNDGSILPRDVGALTAALTKNDTLTSPLGGNTLALPQGQEGRFHNPARHGTTRDGDATAAMSDWIKGTVK